MLNIKTKNRLLILIAITVLGITIITLIFKTLEDNVLYFYSPSEIGENNEIVLNNNMRIGGMVKKGSIETNQNEIDNDIGRAYARYDAGLRASRLMDFDDLLLYMAKLLEDKTTLRVFQKRFQYVKLFQRILTHVAQLLPEPVKPVCLVFVKH